MYDAFVFNIQNNKKKLINIKFLPNFMAKNKKD